MHAAQVHGGRAILPNQRYVSMKLLHLRILALLSVAANIRLCYRGGSANRPQADPRRDRKRPRRSGGYDALKLLALETDVTARDVRLVLATSGGNERYDVRFQRDMRAASAALPGPARYSAPDRRPPDRAAFAGRAGSGAQHDGGNGRWQAAVRSRATLVAMVALARP